jgi:small conductance mechanosensitive channel
MLNYSRRDTWKTPKVLLAAITIVAGLWLIKWFGKIFSYMLERNKVDISLRHFLGSLIDIGFKILLFISAASMVGITTTSVVAVLGAAGLAIGLALQGSLSNFAGGVLILLLRPFRAGDYITAQGHSGTVREIQIFYTVLKTPDNKTVVIPNGKLSNDSIVNFSLEPHRRVDMNFSIGYADDVKKAKEILKTLIEKDKRILSEPPPQIIVSELAANSVNLTIKVWTNTGEYWDVYYSMQELVKEEFGHSALNAPSIKVEKAPADQGDVPTKKFGLPSETIAPEAAVLTTVKKPDNTKPSQENP